GTADISTFSGGFAVRAGPTRQTVTIDGGPAHREDWDPIRHLDCAGLPVTLEDTDPYRDCYELPLIPRGPPSAAESWRRLLAGAWHGIQAEVPGLIPALQIMLRTVTPLRPDGTGHFLSAASRHAFGAVGLAIAS